MIDSILFALDIPQASYAAGQVMPMKIIRGPSVVRDGYGTAILKQVMVFASAHTISNGTYVTFKNANWNDCMASTLSSLTGNNAYAAFSKVSPMIQKCGDVELQPNSAFEATVIVGEANTTSVDNTVFVLVDIDYPSVQAIAKPAEEKGMPVTIMRNDTVTATAAGSAESMVWNTINVDEFKAGYRYLLAQVGCFDSSNNVGFVAFSGAPSMNGLVRIIPVIPRLAIASRLELEYSTPLVKGPMNIEYAIVGTAGTITEQLECDYIRR